MPARSILTRALLVFAVCSRFQTTVAADEADRTPGITWIQLAPENQFALPAGHRFVPLRVKQCLLSSTNRMRIEDGDHVLICDCPTGEALLLDLRSKTARKQQEDVKPDLYEQLKKPLFDRGVTIQGQSRIFGRAATICAWQHNPSSLIWCDSETGKVLYGEDWGIVDGQEQGISQVSLNFDYQASLDRRLFSLEPPPGFKLIRRGDYAGQRKQPLVRPLPH
jgi:hypothetical protein